MKTLKDLFQQTVRDMYSSETLILRALPDMARAAQSPQLRDAINNHINQTEGHIRRIELVCQGLGFSPEGQTCQGTIGIIREANEFIQEFGATPAGDAAIIACAQKVEHYEICNYGTCIAWAEILGYDDASDQFQKTLGEEEDCDEKLTSLADGDLNEAAMVDQSGNRVKVL